MPTTALGFRYPSSTDDVRPYEDLQLLAEDLETYLQWHRNSPAARLRQTSPQAIPNSTSTALAFQDEDFDIDPTSTGGHSTVTNTSRYTVQYAGLYIVGGGASFAGNTTGVRVLSWAINGSHVAGSDVLVNPVSGNTTRMAARGDSYRLNPGDYVELHALHTAGVSLNTATSADEQATLSITWIRP